MSGARLWVELLWGLPTGRACFRRLQLLSFDAPGLELAVVPWPVYLQPALSPNTWIQKVPGLAWAAHVFAWKFISDSMANGCLALGTAGPGPAGPGSSPWAPLALTLGTAGPGPGHCWPRALRHVPLLVSGSARPSEIGFAAEAYLRESRAGAGPGGRARGPGQTQEDGRQKKYARILRL